MSRRGARLGFAAALALLSALAATPAPATAPRATLPASKADQVELTDAQMMAYLGAQRELAGVIFRLPSDPGNDSADASGARIAAILTRYGFATIDDYRNVARNVSLVLEGVDPQTHAYVGAEAMLRRQLEALDADPSAGPDERDAVKAELNAQIKAIAPIRFPGNIALVMRYLGVILATSPFGGTAYEE